MIVYVVCVLISLFSLIYFYFKYKYLYWPRKNFVQDEPEFPYGNFKGVLKTVPFNDIIQKFYDKYKGKVQLIGTYFFVKPCLLVFDLDLYKNILVKDFSYFHGRGIYHNEDFDPLSASLLALDGQKWKRMRTKLSPTFTSGRMKFMFQTVLNIGNQLVSILNEKIEQEKDLMIEPKDILACFATDVIGSCAFGIECNSLKNPDVEFRKLGNTLLTYRPGLIQEFIINTYPKLARKLKLRITSYEAENFYMRVVRETIDYREKNNVIRNDFMQLLINMKNENTEDNITLEEIAAQVSLFFSAGFETSSTLLGFLLYELALNQSIQDKVREEITNVLLKYDGNFTYEAMQEMNYMDQVIYEGLRKYPALPVLSRYSSQDYEVPGTSQIIPKDTLVLLPLQAIHFDPEFYPNPNDFNPERFKSENFHEMHNSVTWLSFGLGPRNCIGMRFGLMQVKISLFSLIRNFKFEKCEKTPIPLEFDPQKFILNAKTLIYLKIVKV